MERGPASRRHCARSAAYSADPSQHPSQLMVGDARSGRWLRLNGFPSVAQVLDAVARAGQ